MNIRPYETTDESALIRLWEDCGLVVPQNDPRKDIQRKLKVQPELFLVGVIDDELVAGVMAGYEGHRGWINYLAVSPDHRRKGLGRRMMAAAEDQLRAMGCPKINLQVRATNKAVLDFYFRIGFGDDQVMGLGKRLEED